MDYYRARSDSIPFAIKIISRYIWEDIVLPKDKQEQLRELCNYIKHHQQVYEILDFDKHSRGTGIFIMNALLESLRHYDRLDPLDPDLRTTPKRPE